MLPDAIPLSQINHNNTLQSNTEEVAKLKEKLPDLITSSPSRSKESSPSSTSEIYKSTETLCDELLLSDVQDKLTADESETYYSDGTQKYKKSRDKLKLSLTDIKRVPIVTITSPSPTNEKSYEETSIETVKLTIPKEVRNQPDQSDGNSSFDKLKRDLRQRKARNRISIGELRPLSTENARRKINKYFTNEKKEKTIDQSAQDPKSSDVKVVKLDVKPKLSTKVEAKDLMKYFQKATQESFDKPEAKDKKESKSSKVESNIEVNTVELSDIDIDSINKEFEQIEQENERIVSIDAKDIESKLHLSTPSLILDIENMNSQQDAAHVNEMEEFQQLFDVSGNEVLGLEPQHISEKNKNLNDTSQIDSDKGNQNIATDSPKKEINLEQTSLPVQQIDNVTEIKSHESITSHLCENEVHPKQLPINDSSESKSHENTVIDSHKNESNTESRNVEPDALKSKLCEEKDKTAVNHLVKEINVKETNLRPKSDALEVKQNEKETNKPYLLQAAEQRTFTSQIKNKLREKAIGQSTKTNKHNVLHSSDNTLNIRKGTTNQFETLLKNSRSSSELPALSTDYDQIARIKIVERNIETPKRVDQMNMNNNSVVPNTEKDAIPKRPERKYEHRESNFLIKPDTSNVQLTPDVPVRRKSLKRKSIVPSSSEKSTSNVQSSSTAINDRLTAADATLNEHKNTINIGANKLKHSTEIGHSERSKPVNTLGNTTNEHKHSHLTKSLPLLNTDLRESTKSVPPKNDRTKKDKCVVS
ncbi:unnamed protein product [Xylocopa violacea]|uniref:Uncharacterized protein n=1 Tax=Xylocopa violacea TaxID=135666 RepID=A0ABP1N6I8_XYLVO